MTAIQLEKLIRGLKKGNQREVVIRVQGSNFKRSLEKSRLLMEKMEREMRIQKLELAIKKMNIQRSWV